MNTLPLPNRALVLVLDGVGYSAKTEKVILRELLQSLSNDDVHRLHECISSFFAVDLSADSDSEDLLTLLLSPVPVQLLGNYLPRTEFDRILSAIAEAKEYLTEHFPSLSTDLDSKLQNLAITFRYVPWLSHTPNLLDIRNRNLSLPTKAAGLYAGFEDIEPEIQGNSDTGHQQIGNLVLARQTSLEISQSIDDGSFFTNPILLDTLKRAVARGSNISFSFLLSGEHGNDGRVHSAWTHLEAFLELVFKRLQISPRRVKMQAILDGRDAPPYSSIQEVEGCGDFLGKLAKLLSTYQATGILSWVIGRSLAMDRDFNEENTKADYRLLTGHASHSVKDLIELRHLIAQLHASGLADSDMEPIFVLDPDGSAPRLAVGDTFVNLNFRADRQRARMAALSGNREFLAREALSRSKWWSLDWIESLELELCGIAEYAPELNEMTGIRTIFPNRPHEHNYLSLMPSVFHHKGEPFSYLLVAESNKAPHMGYFIRGRREEPAYPDLEQRKIVTSYGREAGVENDDDCFRTPQMKNFEILGILANELVRNEFQLIVANFSNCDMLGHLMMRHFDSVVAAYEHLDEALGILVPFAQKHGYSVIITSDHGNIEEYSASHTANEVLTTFISPDGHYRLRNDFEPMRLFDIGWCLAYILGIEAEMSAALPEVPEILIERGLVGRCLVE